MLDQKKLASIKRQIVMMKKSLDDLLPPGVDTQICFYDNGGIRFDVSDWEKGVPINDKTQRRYYIDVMWRDGEWGFDVSSHINSSFARKGILLEEKEAGTSA